MRDKLEAGLFASKFYEATCIGQIPPRFLKPRRVGLEAGIFASNFFVYNKIIALDVLGLFTPSFVVPDFQSGSSVVFVSVDTIHELYLYGRQRAFQKFQTFEKLCRRKGRGWSFRQ